MPQRRTLHDEFFRKAKAEGYVARSAYKLAEIDDKRSVLKRRQRVLDLGCAPGSWMQIARERVGPRGVIVGIDLNPATVDPGGPGRVLIGDAFEISPDELMAPAGGPFDVVISDMAPNTTGAGDHFKSVHLCDRVLELAQTVLLPGGNLVMKVFEGEAYSDLLSRTGAVFAKAKGFKPKASRDVSREMFVIAHGFRGATPADQDGAG